MRLFRYIATALYAIIWLIYIFTHQHLVLSQQNTIKVWLVIAGLILIVWWVLVVYHYFFDFRRTNLRQIDKMNGLDFENYTAKLLEKSGFENVVVTPATRDQGVDITAKLDGETYGFQCKRYDHPVDNSAVQEIFTGCAFYHLQNPVVITNTTFSPSAQELATGVGVEMVDRDVLGQWLEKIKHQKNKA
ncbi:restriction endonuclease [Lapidilactobacillus bayanensis]|uniref:restriction endonuclease n=1 Tax=Lapidilactobacillus bayanensis TaxID=2485998 RepID=UPI000F76A906|nr:restriction endonuclease [Lapidilactobacillus bayanensis]